MLRIGSAGKRRMNAPSITVACRKCRQVFAPDFKSRKIWRCTHCNSKNPNLRRHYRSVADLMILGLCVSALVIGILLTRRGITFGTLLVGADSALLLFTIILIYRSRAPWRDLRVNVLIWVVFGIAFVCNILIPLIFSGHVGPAAGIYILIFSYLFWLKRAATKLQVTGHSVSEQPTISD